MKANLPLLLVISGIALVVFGVAGQGAPFTGSSSGPKEGVECQVTIHNPVGGDAEITGIACDKVQASCLFPFSAGTFFGYTDEGSVQLTVDGETVGSEKYLIDEGKTRVISFEEGCLPAKQHTYRAKIFDEAGLEISSYQVSEKLS